MNTVRDGVKCISLNVSLNNIANFNEISIKHYEKLLKLKFFKDYKYAVVKF